ncbi:glycoside hydrolase family 38 C-terminal domain-containing protein [Mucilaginibacter sp. AK015]|uniref:glycoside hydrolase family 38 N-terminal domain-containing protein n=1 Tax=Mucilaginibacter sp. AK015 TaxID=2723072 RepID=UPI00162172B6|nr:glycoside hydrolase family 38 C-terminal domain-containing protein [Mucilaginibacter sp. AK015]MBB5396114.1 hypothetical protein [Mucilaginibacter sp. AK015]
MFKYLSLCLLCISYAGYGQSKASHLKHTASKANYTKTQPAPFDCDVKAVYRHRPDGKPGREIMLNFKSRFAGKGTITVNCIGQKEITTIQAGKGLDSLAVLLPDNAGVDNACQATITLRAAGKTYAKTIDVPAKRHWTVYIYPHSHVDIGYTNTQANIEVIHKRNLVNAIKLGKQTANYPEDARFKWNPEVLWPVERYLKTAGAKEKQYLIEGIQKGYLQLDAGYVNMNTSASADEELLQYFSYAKKIEKLTGKKIETLVQTDVPGMSWGVVPAAAKFGIKYCFALNNGWGRVGHSTDLSFKPFWWVGPDGKSKILFLQPGSYRPGAEAKGHDYWPLMSGQTDTSKLLKIIKTDHPRKNFVDTYLAKALPELEASGTYPYDIFAMSWAMADNTPIDADLPDAVKSWNEDYAYPHLVIASATQVMQTFEKKYGDQLPVMKGDFTEYWTDGLGSAAKQTSMNSSSKERLIQAKTLWDMLHPGAPAPQQKFDEAWRNVIMADEHTWCFIDPSKQPITNNILKTKFGFFQNAHDMSADLIDSALAPVNKGGSKVIGVFNTLVWPRGGLVYVPAEQSKGYGKVVDEHGKPVISQRLSTGNLVFYSSDVPALSSKRYTLKKGEPKPSNALVHGNNLDNGLLQAVINTQTGDISSLKKEGYEFVDTKHSLNSYRYLHADDDASKATGTSDVKITIKENGPLVATLQVISKVEGCNSLTREVTLVAGSPSLEITNYIDKQPITKKEGVHFGFAFNIPNPETRVDIPFGILALEKDQLPGANRNWITFQRWLDISNNERGVTWCSLDAPVFEDGGITANIIGSGANSPKWITKLQPNATIYSWVMNNHWHTNFPLSQEGMVKFRYRLLPHNNKYDAAAANRYGTEQAQPLIASPVNVDHQQ